MNDVPRCDEKKPDPDHPWRYVCPECDGQVQASGYSTVRYKCDTCGEQYDKNELKDRLNYD